jgi:type I restriction enzyme R subunit
LLNEEDTRAGLVDPKLQESGWTPEKVSTGTRVAPGRLLDEKGNRKPGTEIDYVLHVSSLPIAVVEAEPESKSALSGMQQAKDDAKNYLDVLFAYCTNGHEIEEFDFTTNTQTTLEKFPRPEELLYRYYRHRIGSVTSIVRVNPLEVSATGTKKPWYPQEVATRRGIERILNGKKRVLLAMATGAGKTFVAFLIVYKLIKSGYFRRVLYLTDRIFLRDHAYREFEPLGDARDFIEEGKAPKNRDVYFTTYQAMYSGAEGTRLYQQYPPDFFDLVIIDECHRSGYGTWRQILDYFGNAVHLGMTATPKRDDNIDTYDYFGEPAYAYSMGQAIEDGFLAPFQIFRIFTNIDRDGLRIKDAIYQGAQIFVPEEADLKEIYAMEDFEREIVLPDRTAEICEHLANLLRTLGPKQRSIVFCVSMEHAASVAKVLQNRFSDLGFSDYAVRIVSEEPQVKMIYEQFRDSDKPTPVVATTVDLLTTGVDVPSVHNVVMIRPISSKVMFKQIIGRGARIDPITKKYFFRIIDYVNATRLLDDWDYPPSGKYGKVVEGPFDLSISGVILHHETQMPITNARLVAQVGPNLQRAARSDSKGRFVLANLPHSPVTIHIGSTGYQSREMTMTASPEMSSVIVELKPESPVEKKIMLKGIEVFIANEVRIVLTDDGKTLTEAEYIEYSKKGVIERATTLHDLREIWIDGQKRRKFLDALRMSSIHPDLIAGLLKRPDADSFDALAHIAFGVPMLTREERAGALKNLNSTLFDSLAPRAQGVLLALLDKYRAGGVEEISRKEIFRIPPFDEMGYLKGVAEMFGGFDNLRKAIDEVQRGLYPTELTSGGSVL